jgi:2-phosphosulfolactate phosphatase
MRIAVAFAPNDVAPADVAGRAVAVVDVLRATTTICAALHHGARAVITAAEIDDAARIAQAIDRREVLLCGERGGRAIPGFALGNSPREMGPEVVGGKTLVMTTTNGTRALLATAGAREVIVAAGVNLTAASARLAEHLAAGHEVLILCAGRERAFALDDAYIAGRLLVTALQGSRSRKGMNDAAIATLDLVRRYGDRMDRPLRLSEAGRSLQALGFGDDVLAAAAEDAHPVLPIYHDRRVTLAPSRIAT